VTVAERAATRVLRSAASFGFSCFRAIGAGGRAGDESFRPLAGPLDRGDLADPVATAGPAGFVVLAPLASTTAERVGTNVGPSLPGAVGFATDSSDSRWWRLTASIRWFAASSRGVADAAGAAASGVVTVAAWGQIVAAVWGSILLATTWGSTGTATAGYCCEAIAVSVGGTRGTVRAGVAVACP
jgi:hypothetical protein